MCPGCSGCLECGEIPTVDAILKHITKSPGSERGMVCFNMAEYLKGNTMSRNASYKAAEAVGGLFNLVLIASVRARELKSGHAPKVKMEPGSGTTSTALAEIEQGLVGAEYLRKVVAARQH